MPISNFSVFRVNYGSIVINADPQTLAANDANSHDFFLQFVRFAARVYRFWRSFPSHRPDVLREKRDNSNYLTPVATFMAYA